MEKINTKSESIESNIHYTALFVTDKENIIRTFPPKHENVFAHHITLEYKPDNLDGIEVGKKHTIKIIGRASDDKGDALLIEGAESKNKMPHITLSCAEGVKPVYSNELLENNEIEYFEEPIEIELTEGYTIENGDIITE